MLIAENFVRKAILPSSEEMKAEVDKSLRDFLENKLPN